MDKDINWFNTYDKYIEVCQLFLEAKNQALLTVEEINLVKDKMDLALKNWTESSDFNRPDTLAFTVAHEVSLLRKDIMMGHSLDKLEAEAKAKRIAELKAVEN